MTLFPTLCCHAPLGCIFCCHAPPGCTAWLHIMLSCTAWLHIPLGCIFEPISGRVDRASATEAVDTGSIPGRVKPKIRKIGIHSFPA